MKAFFVIHLLWACLLAFCFNANKSSELFDLIISVVCYAWLICAVGLFFRQRWAWWGSLLSLCTMMALFSTGVIGVLFHLVSGHPAASWMTGDSAENWLLWGAFLGLFVPCAGLLGTGNHDLTFRRRPRLLGVKQWLCGNLLTLPILEQTPQGALIMMKMTELIGQELQWIQPHALKMEYELRAGDKIAATLRFRSSFGSFATAVSADGSWTFKRVGFWHTRATVRASGSETDLAVFKNNTWSGGGTLELPDGRKYPANTNFWATQYEFKTERGEPLISYKKIGGLLHLSSRVEIHAPSKEVAEMPWMVSLGWYLTVMMYIDSAAAGAAAAA